MLEMFGHRVTGVSDGNEVLTKVDDSYDVIILDINMPNRDGFNTLEKINGLNYDIPVLFLTGVGSMDYAVKAIHLGAYDFLTKPIEDIEIFNVKIERALEKRMYVLQERKYREALEEDVRVKAMQLKEQNDLLVKYSDSLENATVLLMSSLQNAMEAKDIYTAGHTLRVTRYGQQLGKSMGLTEDELVVLKRASQFHDIGKLVIDLSSIQKPGKLTEHEWNLIRKHPSVGATIVEPLEFMEKEQFIIRHHHERIDGKGYPDGLAGDQIDQLTKILTVVDSYDAMTSKRNYRENMTMEEAVEELNICSGTQFDSEVVDHFTRNIISFVPVESAVH
ncbi:HDIG domain-containing protein [Desulforhopalus singaporensis]|uniref:HDIG domain-containing protein n=2 Tax=Desulforhopalus singaporensis TaxID=91360 RepID=A0A1H0VAY8_9BACT|nr:HDIG domain-containing protein [Desulforhopalus singaporensis]